MTAESLSPTVTHPRKKKIVLCCDGTGNEFSGPNSDPNDKNSGQNSNVVKLYTALQIDNDQVGYYHPGVGTMGAPTATHWWSRRWSQIKGLAFGAGFRDNVLDAYRYLMEVYNDNGGNGNEDEVYIFGFSRGAYTARALAGFLHGYGLLCRGNEGHIPYAWRMYVGQHNDRLKHHVAPDKAFKATFSHKDFTIQFVGVWDTVSSVGWITTPLRLFNLAQNDTVLRGRHAISIDEHRCFFQDNLWGVSVEGQDLVQVWFAGVHSDVGGSYLQPECGLSDITLRWMLKEVGVVPLPDGTYPAGPGVLLNKARHDLVLGIMPNPVVDPELICIPPTSSEPHNSLTWKWWLLELLPHLYYNKDDVTEQRRVPLGLRRRQLPPGALVHESVAERMDKTESNYMPRNVRRQELIRSASDPQPFSADGTQYYRFTPKGRKPNGKVFELFDRFVVTWLFTIFDIFILLPVEIQLRVYIVPAASAGQAGQDRRRSAATRIANEEAVLAIENDALHLALRDVVVDADRSIGAEHVQFRPLAQTRSSPPRPWDAWAATVPSTQEASRAIAPAPAPTAPGAASSRCLAETSLALLFHRVKSTHQLDRFPRDLGSGLFRVDHLSSHVRPTSCARDLVARNDAVVAAVSVCKKNLPIILQKILRSIATAIQREVEDVVWIAIVADIDPHASVGGLTLAQHGHDRVVGGHHVRGSHSLRHQFPQWFGQIGHISAPDRLRRPRDLEPLPLKDVFQSI